MKIATKTGDKGFSGLLGGKRLSKSDLIFEVLGNIDELNSVLGWCKLVMEEGEIKRLLSDIQEDLYKIMAIINDAKNVKMKGLKFIEDHLEKHENKLETLIKFVKPGSNEISARLHIARCVCRRAERSVVKLHESKKMPEEIMKYLNRLSDLLMILACRFD